MSVAPAMSLKRSGRIRRARGGWSRFSPVRRAHLHVKQALENADKGARLLFGQESRDLPDFFQITGDAGFGRHPLIRGRQPNHELHHIVRTGVIAALNYFRTKLSAATPIVNLVSKRY